MSEFHPTVIIGKDVRIGKNVKIHPYCVIDGEIEIADECEIGPFVRITGWVKIGKGTVIYPFAAIGEPPQDYSFDGQKGLIEIGEECIIREGVTIHTPVNGVGGEKTIVGNKCFLMANSHVAHNCKLGNNVILANGCLLAGYVEVEDFAFLSGNVTVHQHCRIGEYSMTSGLSKIPQDIPPYSLVEGSPAEFRGINVVGLKRRGFSEEDRKIIKQAYKILYDKSRPRSESLAIIEKEYSSNKYVAHIVDFVKKSKRGILNSHHE